MELAQLLSMGFPDGLAAQALDATGGRSVADAAEWILSNSGDTPVSDSTRNNLMSNLTKSSSTPPPFQPKLDRFFNFQAKKDQETRNKRLKKEDGAEDEEQQSPFIPRNRPKHQLLSLQSSPSLRQKLPHEPLSERMRPRNIDDIVGQDHLLAGNCLIRSAIDSNRLPSMVFWGPPGTGKTSLARAIFNSSSISSYYRMVSLSAVTCGVKDIRDAVEEARKSKVTINKRTILFVDEVHRFNKSQQDSFLPVIEDGSIVFIGATTENPSFHLITPLLSRCRVLTLRPLKPHHVATLLKRAVTDCDKGLASSITAAEWSSRLRVEADDDAIDFLSAHCDGDARVALNALEISGITAVARARLAVAASPNNLSEGGDKEDVLNVVGNVSTAKVTLEDAKEALQSKHLAYDKAGEEHYNLISALHKSMRGSDADAAIYWLARMLEGGEEPLYIARRLIRFASEDVGLADTSALTQAVACYQACHFLGMPECNVNLAQCVSYLALAPKSVAVYRALEAALKVVRESVGQNEGVPLHLRNAPTKLMKEIGYGKGYIYPPDDPSSSQTYLPPSLHGYKFLNWPRDSDCDQ